MQSRNGGILLGLEKSGRSDELRLADVSGPRNRATHVCLRKEEEEDK